MATKPSPFNKLINLVVLAILVYVLVSSYFFPSNPKEGKLDATGLLQTQSQVNPISSSFSQWSQMFGVMGNSIRPVLKVVKEVEGNGNPIVCGQDISYQYSDTIIGETESFIHNKTHSLRLGSEPLIEGHFQALLPMKVGGERTVQFASMWGYQGGQYVNAQGKDIESHIALISAAPSPLTMSMPLRIFYKTPHNVTDDTMRCGAVLNAKLTIWTVDGKQIYPLESKEPQWSEITIGKADVPFGMELALQKLSLGESATAIIPHELVKLFNAKEPLSDVAKNISDIQFPKNQAIIVDIQTEAVKKATATPTQAAAEAPANTQAPAAPSPKP